MEFSFLFIFACVLYLLLRELFSSCSKRGLAVAAHGLLIVSASLIEEHELQGARASVVVACWLCICSLQTLEHRLSGCSSWVWLLHGMWDLPRPGVKLLSPALAGGFFTTELPRKPKRFLKKLNDLSIPLLCIYAEKNIIQKGICTPIFIATLYTIVNSIYYYNSQNNETT